MHYHATNALKIALTDSSRQPCFIDPDEPRSATIATGSGHVGRRCARLGLRRHQQRAAHSRPRCFSNGAADDRAAAPTIRSDGPHPQDRARRDRHAGEPRFDSYFGTYPGANGIPMANGVPTVCLPSSPALETCSAPFHDANDVDIGGPHSTTRPLRTSTTARMDGFILSARSGGGARCQDPFEPDLWTPART